MSVYLRLSFHGFWLCIACRSLAAVYLNSCEVPNTVRSTPYGVYIHLPHKMNLFVEAIVCVLGCLYALLSDIVIPKPKFLLLIALPCALYNHSRFKTPCIPYELFYLFGNFDGTAIGMSVFSAA